MIFASIIAYFKDRMAKQAEFLRLLDEINSLSDRDLRDLRADRMEMIRHARQQVYGAQAV
ncbi:hypothetical protein ACETRX_25685 [Labrys portucalensis]|uniref:DUF1127 domain-containing protein n=1 Tax=Labrys neptuniae TaxID=376174 RepID=A0ABV3PQT3_9HYPH|nr:hypothetical protein [Labrys neptuniae]MDT3380353.1 hypothetical protein [Labrys neptuniae]